MLDLIRRKQKSTIIKIVFWTIIAAFVGTIFLVWGRGRDGGQDATATALVINGSEIPLDSYQRAYSNLYTLYQNLYREQFTPEMEKQLGLKQMALDRVIDQALLVQEARDRGIEVSKGELVNSIAEIPTFQENGAFSRDRYLQVLQYQRITPDEFEASQRRQLLINKVVAEIQGSVSVSDEEIVDEFRRRNEEVNLNYVTFAGPLFEEKVEIDAQELSEWFQDNQEQFRIPERVSLRYLEFEPARYEDDVTFDEGELQRYYRRHLDQFEIPEQVQASHVLIRVTEGADEEKVAKRRELAQSVLEEVKAGGDFSELARKYSDDKSSAQKGGDLGYFPRGTMVAPFEEAAFSLDPGQISDLVRTPFGFHIIKVTGRIDAGVKPFEDVSQEVKDGLREEKARQVAIEKAMDAYNRNRKTGDLEAAAENNDLSIEETEFFARGEAVAGIGPNPEVTETAFQLEQGEMAKPVVLPQGVFLVKLRERKESRLPELQEVRSEVEEAFRREKAMKLAEEKADQFLERLKAGEDLSGLAADAGLEIRETGPFSRTYETFVPGIGNQKELAESAFQAEEEGFVMPQVYESGNKLIVATLKSRQAADMDALDQGTRDEIRTALKAQREQESLDAELQSLREASEIEIAPVLANLMER